jgi:uncharacterized protein (UPF0332 family)
VTPEAREHFAKGRQCLTRGRTILAAGVGEDAGRNAYLAAFHAAQALIAERTGKDAKTHKGVDAQFARLTRNEPRLSLELRRQFLAQAYDIKSIADCGLGHDTDVPLDRAGAAIETAEQFVNGRGAVNVTAREFGEHFFIYPWAVRRAGMLLPSGPLSRTLYSRKNE